MVTPTGSIDAYRNLPVDFLSPLDVLDRYGTTAIPHVLYYTGDNFNDFGAMQYTFTAPAEGMFTFNTEIGTDVGYSPILFSVTPDDSGLHSNFERVLPEMHLNDNFLLEHDVRFVVEVTGQLEQGFTITVMQVDGDLEFTLPDDLEWIMYFDAEFNEEFYVTAEPVESFGLYRNVHIGLIRDLSDGTGDSGELFALNDGNWMLIGQVTFSSPVLPFSDVDFAPFSSQNRQPLAVGLPDGRVIFVYNIEAANALEADVFVLEGFHVWFNTLTLTFRGNQGTPAAMQQTVWRMPASDFPFGYNFNRFPVVFPLDFTYPLNPVPQFPTREGFEFMGWFDTRNTTGGNRITEDSTATITNNTFYARWRPALTIDAPANDDIVEPDYDLTVKWTGNPNARHFITLRNLNTGSVPSTINNREVFDGYFVIDQQYLPAGQRFSVTVRASIDNSSTISSMSSNSSTVSFEVGTFDTPFFRLGFSEWTVGGSRVITYAVNPGAEGRSIELYYPRNPVYPHGYQRATLRTIADRTPQANMPRFMINVGFFTVANPNSIAYGMFFCSANGFLENPPLGGWVDYYYSLIYFSDGRPARVVPNNNYLEREYILGLNPTFVISGNDRANPSGSVARSMIGVRPDNTLIFMMIDSGSPGVDGGLPTAEGRRILTNYMGATLTLNMDGCASSQLFYDGTLYRTGRTVGTVFKIW
ncbi:MAG: phosphodiester glycosidase family protein [Defluviitaleaceae bacterium]|nr:phosphodiester glycosidase family protein [Defluviitaleaceae bacterium]